MELLIRVTDKVNKEDFYKNCQCTKRGDVIVAQPDGWSWGTEELKDPNYRILKVPDMLPSDAAALLAPQIDTDPANPSKTLLRRAFKINLDDPVLALSLQTFLADDARSKPTLTSPISATTILSAKTEKPVVADPAVFGDSLNTF